jgi:predicted transcriptional regulator
VTGASTLAEEFAKSHGKKVGEVMTTGVISVTEETRLPDIAALFERKRIKRVPVVKDGKLVGIVSRANLTQALASVVGRIDQNDETDRQIRLDLQARLREQIWTDFGSQQRRGASMGAGRLRGGTQGAAGACGKRARSVSGCR